MNERQQTELRALREEQQALKLRLGALENRLIRFEADAVGDAGQPGKRGSSRRCRSLAGAKEAAAKSTPRRAGLLGRHRGGRRLAHPRRPSPRRPRVPPVRLPPGACPLPPAPAASLPASGPLPAPPPPVRRESLEVQIGTTWLVRIGVVLGLTALAFLGAYLYQNVIPHLGPAAKIALLYLGAFTLTGLGALAGTLPPGTASNPGCATTRTWSSRADLSAVYYVTYAAHYFENLRVIPSALLAGALLLAWTAFMVFLADRRNSETLATVAILLAYYTAAINDGVAGFTLFSNLALTAGAVFLLRRHLWRVFPFASLLATFGSYAFWTYYHSALGWRGLDAPPVHATHGAGGFWVEAAFLFVYWALVHLGGVLGRTKGCCLGCGGRVLPV